MKKPALIKGLIKIAAILFLCCPVSEAAGAEEILKRVFEKYSGLDTYSADVEIVKTITSSGAENRYSTLYRLDLQRPNRFALRHREGFPGRTIISDGETMWIYMPSIQKYTSLSAPLRAEDILRPSLKSPEGFSEEQLAIFSFTGSPGNFIEIDEVKEGDVRLEEDRDYYFLEMEKDGAAINLKIYKDDFSLYSIELDMGIPLTLEQRQFMDYSESISINYREIHHNPLFNHDIEENVFLFTPAEEAEQAPDLMFNQKEPVFPFAGTPVGEYKLKDPESGELFTISEFTGEVILICFVNPSQPESESLIMELSGQAQKLKDIKVLIVSFPEDKEELMELALKGGDIFTPALDIEPYIFESLGLSDLPAALTVGPGGEVQQVYTGYFKGIAGMIAQETGLISEGISLSEPRQVSRLSGLELKWNIPLNSSALKSNKEIYALTPAGSIYRISPRGAVKDAFPVPDNFNRLEIFHLKKDSPTHILYMEKGSELKLISRDTGFSSLFSVEGSINMIRPLDLNNDGNQEIILALSGEPGLMAVSPEGSLIFKSTQVRNIISFDITEGKDGQNEFLAVSGSGKLYRITSEGKVKDKISTGIIARFVKTVGESILVSGSLKDMEIIKFLDAEGGLKWELILGISETASLSSAHLHPRGNLLACGMRNGTLIVFDSSGHIRARADSRGMDLQVRWIVFEEAHVNLITSSREEGITSYIFTGVAE